MSKLKNIRQAKLKNKRVLMRVDLNISFTDSKIDRNEIYRIEAAMPTLRYLIRNRAKIILVTHLGRPDGKVAEELRLDLVAKELGKLLKKKIHKLNSAIGREAQRAVAGMRPSDIIMLENIRFYPEDEKNSPKLAKELASLGDVFVNDAFAVSHRSHASVVGIARYLPSYAGFLLKKEVEELDKILHHPKRPLAVIIGGAKVSTKIKVIEKFLEKADKLFLGGALVNTVFAAKGISMGKSFVEKEMFKVVDRTNLDNPKLVLPTDLVCQNSEVSVKSINAVQENESVFDIGPRSTELFLESIKTAKMIVWNGPLGMIEKKPFDRASEIIAKAIAQHPAYSVVGGGDTVAFIKKLGLEKKFNYVSTGGGAMLDYLVNETLPGIEALKRCKRFGK